MRRWRQFRAKVLMAVLALGVSACDFLGSNGTDCPETGYRFGDIDTVRQRMEQTLYGQTALEPWQQTAGYRQCLQAFLVNLDAMRCLEDPVLICNNIHSIGHPAIRSAD